MSYPILHLLDRTITTTPVTLAAWFKVAVTAGYIPLYLGNTITADGWWMGVGADGHVEATAVSGNLGAYSQAESTTGYTLGTWHHGCSVFESSTSRTAYIDGGNSGTDTVSITPAAAITGFSIGVARSGSGPLGYFNGLIAEVAVWDVALTPAEIASLARGVSPIFIRPENLFAYWPLIGRASPDLELINALSVSVVNSPPQADHCRVVYPSAGLIPTHTPAPGSVEPPLISNPFSVFAPAVTVGAAIPTLVPPVVTSPFIVYAPTVATDLGFAPPVIANPFTVYAPTVSLQESTIQEDSRELEPHNLKVRIVDFVGGDDLRITRLYTELAGGILINKAYLTIKRRAKDDTDAQAIVQKTINTSEQASGKIQDNDTTGGSIQLYFDLSKDDTAALTPLIAYHYDVQVHTIGNAVYTCEMGTITMRQGVTHATS